MSKDKFSILTLSIIYLLSGCGSKTQLPDHPIIYEQNENSEEGYSYLSHDDKMFLPYCAYDAKYMGDCIGYCDLPADEYTDSSRVYIFEVKGFSSDEWIIETLTLEHCNEGMILREINATNIPDGLASEYPWNE